MGHGRLHVPEERPHRRRAAAVPAGLPAVHADAGQRDLRRRWPATTSTPRSPTRCSRGRRGLGIRTDRSETSGTASTRTSRPSSTSPTATRSTTRYHTHGILGFTPEGSDAGAPENASGFVFQDDEADIAGGVPAPPAVLARPARSAADPANPVSHLGNGCEDFYVETFAVLLRRPADGRGDREALARRRAAALPGQRRQGPAGADQGGPGRRAVQQRRRASTSTALRGEVQGHRAGRRGRGLVRGRRRSTRRTSPTRRASESGEKVLILSAENYIAGVRRRTRSGPALPQYYTDALDARRRLRHLRRRRAGQRRAGRPRRAEPLRRRDLVHGRRRPHPPARPAGRHRHARASAVEEMIDVRDFLNEGGKLLFTGKDAGTQYANADEFRNFGFPEPRDAARRRVLQQERHGHGPDTDGVRSVARVRRGRPGDGRRVHQHNDDFLQYYLGAYIRASPGNSFDDEAGAAVRPGRHRRRAVRGLSLRLRRDGRRQPGPLRDVRGDQLASCRRTRFPLYASSRKAADLAAARRGAVQPVQRHAVHGRGRGQPRLQAAEQDGRPPGRDQRELSFKFSADVEADWDLVAVEVHDIGRRTTWTTLAGRRRHTG